MIDPTSKQLQALANEIPTTEEWERPFLNGSPSRYERIAAGLRAAAKIARDMELQKKMNATEKLFRESATDLGLTDGEIEHAMEAWRQTSAAYAGTFTTQVLELIQSGFLGGFVHGRKVER